MTTDPSDGRLGLEGFRRRFTLDSKRRHYEKIAPWAFRYQGDAVMALPAAGSECGKAESISMIKKSKPCINFHSEHPRGPYATV